MMKEHKRLDGIDLFRGLAIYGVIIVHIDEGVKVLPTAWSQIHSFALFAVPFFLATSFYLAISKLYFSQQSYPLRSRLVRLLIPYAVWSAFYLIFKSAKFLAVGETSRMLSLFQDPLSLVFFGGAAYHLYFLPLLATGTLLIKLAEFLIAKKTSLKGLALIALGSLLLYGVVLASGNGLDTSNYTAFNPLLLLLSADGNANPFLRWISVEILWVLQCLPYIMIAMLLVHPAINQRTLKVLSNYPLLWLFVFLVVNAFGSLVLPEAAYELARGYTALIAAIAISTILKEHFLIKSLGYCSFGVYLIHLFFVEIFQSVAIRLYPNYVDEATSIFLLLASIVVLLFSWGITMLIMQRKKLSRILFGF